MSALVSIRAARFFLQQYSKKGKHIPEDHNIFQIAIKYAMISKIQNGHQRYPMVLLQGFQKYTRNGIIAIKHTIWQPWFQSGR
jgi:hypothetical protein